jgi:hypothetical protein
VLRESRGVVNRAVRGLRVLSFGKQNIFMLTGMIVRSCAPDVASCCESSPDDSQLASPPPRAAYDRFAIDRDAKWRCGGVIWRPGASFRGRAWS